MKVNYDAQTDTLTVVFRDVPVAESDEDKPGVILDYEAIGNIVAIEVLDASTRVEEPRNVTVQTEGSRRFAGAGQSTKTSRLPMKNTARASQQSKNNPRPMHSISCEEGRMYIDRARAAPLLVSGLFLILTLQMLSGCGKSDEEAALRDKAVSERAIADAQAELDADHEKFRRMATGELQAPPVAPARPESAAAVASQPLATASKEAPPAVSSPPTPATVSAVAAPRSAENVFGEVAPSVARIQVMDASGRLIATGSGVVIDKAVVLTNCHVATRGAKLTVKISDTVMPATIQLADEGFDLCRLSVPGLAAPPVVIGSVGSLRTGQRVYAIGAPAGLELTISEGIVSALRKVDEGTVIQTTAPISPGSSGGGLFDASGAMVGVMTFQHRFGQNLNFALPADWIGRMRLRRASDATLHASLSGKSAEGSSAALILGQWICRDWISGRTSQYTFEPDGTVSIAMSDGRVGTLNYRLSGKTLQLTDSKQMLATQIEELTSGKMVLHGRDQSIACER